MSGSIRRGAARRPVQPQRRTSRMIRPSRIDRVLTWLPVSEEALRRAATWLFMGTAGAAALVVGVYFGVPQAAGIALAEQIGNAGFRVNGIEVTGASHMNPMTVYAVVLEEKSRALPLVDVADVRARLLQYPWIADAQVSRRLPDKLLVNIVEREPAAIWQHDGALTLIDASGRPLDTVSAQALPNLPLLIGEGANEQAPQYRQLLDTVPALRPMVRAATWIGNRRWNLTFTTGETLVLPEEDPMLALAKFAAVDGASPLLGKGWLRFEMRDPAHLVARKPGAGSGRSIAGTSAIDAPVVEPDHRKNLPTTADSSEG
ncbi:MAG: cell division protein FtsQ/DivIB [Sphingomonas sp.]|jgi:cell division protein FtsQ